jgi:hypothetical protein
MVMAAALIPATPDARTQLADLNREVRRFAPLGAGLNPLTASPEDIEQAGFPPRPDETVQPELFSVWKDVFTRNLTFEDVNFSLPLPAALNSGSTSTALRRSHREASRNWSGAYITPRDGQMLTQVSGMWQVPTVQPPPGGSMTAAYGSSTWIGLDGQRGYLNSTLPQIGTGQFFNLFGASGSTTEAWVQWWPLCPVTLDLVVLPGDLMLAWLIVVSYTEVHFVIVNISRLRYTPFALPTPSVKMPPHVPLPVQASVSGATAEWVMERPAICPDPDPLTLPSFSPVRFNACVAVSARAPATLPVQERVLVSPKLIRMYSVEESPHRTVTRAVAARPTNAVPPFTSATVTYQT